MVRGPSPALFALALGALLAGAASCAAPTLPLPPPETEVGPPNELGIVEVRGTGAEALSVVVCENTDDQGQVGAARSDDAGAFVVALRAVPGDLIECYYFVGFDRSEPSSPIPVPE